jgi:hypothetical protein
LLGIVGDGAETRRQYHNNAIAPRKVSDIPLKPNLAHARLGRKLDGRP